MRQRLTYQVLANKCFTMAHAAKLRQDWTKQELSLTQEHFNDLRSDMQFIGLFAWSTMTEIPREFECHGVRCVITRE